MCKEFHTRQRMNIPWKTQTPSLNIHFPRIKIDAVRGIIKDEVRKSATDKTTKNMFVTVRSPRFL